MLKLQPQFTLKNTFFFLLKPTMFIK
jgi:hypothetical protein